MQPQQIGFLVAVAACCTDALSLGRLSHDVVPWDIQSAFKDSPPGAYFGVMDPVVKANSLAYCASAGTQYKPECDNKTIDEEYSGGATWERIYSLETSQSTEGGPHVLVFADHSNHRAIFVIRGSCQEGNQFEQCNMDDCFLMQAKGFGDLSSVMYSASGSDLTKCDGYERAGKLNYVDQTEALVKRAQAQLPGYDFLLTGHSMGGLLATIVAVQQPGVLKAVTFAPTPYHDYMKTYMGYSEEQIQAINEQDIVATCDPFDCGINADFAPNPRVGGTTCLYFGTQEPPECGMLKMMTPYLTPDFMWRNKIHFRPTAPMCKGKSHNMERYVDVVHKRRADSPDSPATLPECSLDYSMLQQ